MLSLWWLGNNHRAEQCKFINAVCYNCGKKGHLKAVCKGPKQKGKVAMVKPSKSHDSSAVHRVETQDSGGETYQLFTMNENANSPAFCANLTINGKELLMEIDTGSSVSIISEGTFDKRFADNILLTPSTSKLRTYTGEVMPVVGMAEVDIEYKGQKQCMPLLVVPGNGPSLLGRNWLKHIQLDWREVNRISTSGNSVEAAHSVLQKYPDLMRDDIGTINGVKGHLQVNSEAEPRFCKARNVPYALRDKVEEELSRLERDGIIEPVEFSDWAAPIVPVLKGNGQNVRICGDFKLTVNKASRLDTYPLPRIDDLYASLAGGQSFTKLDLKNAYLQIELEEESKKYVTINTSRGLFQYNRLPFGVSSSPAIFQRVIDNVLQRIPYVCAYLDDILVTGRTDEEHLSNLDKVLSRLAKAGMRLNVDKCTFMAPEVTYLGYRIDTEGLHAVNEKVQAIAMAPAPQNSKQLRSYLGCLNYYGRFIKNLSSEIAPLNKLLTKNEQFVWGSDEENAFQRSKELLQSYDVLVHYDQEKELILSCDASPYGLGVVLQHRMEDGSERPISFAPRTLAPAEKQYSQLEKEALSVVWGVKKFHSYLFGRHFVINNDHKPLEGLLREDKPVPPMASGRIQRWALALSAYEYTFKYKSGEKMGNADAMSRLPLSHEPADVPMPADVVCLLEFIDTSPIDVGMIKQWTDKDAVLSRVRRFVSSGWPESIGDDAELKPYFCRQDELSIQSGCILWGARVVVPLKARERVIDMIHEGHPGIVRMKMFARNYVWWPKLDQDLESKLQRCVPCQSKRHSPAKAPLHPWEYPKRPWSRIHVDYAGPYQGKMLLVIIDAFTKWLEVHVMNSSTAEATVEKLRTTFATFGIPETVVSDNGTCFVSEVFQTSMSRNGIRHIKVAPKHPASNGLAERSVQSVKEGLQDDDRKP